MQYKQFPLCHALAAGHAAENSIPFGAYEVIAKREIPKEDEAIWISAELALLKVVEQHIVTAPKTDLSPEGVSNLLQHLGYHSAAGEIDPEGECIDIDDQLGLGDPAIKALAASFY